MFRKECNLDEKTETLDRELPPDLQFSSDYFPNELLLVIACQMSVFDVPALAVVCRFLASNSNILWKHHADRLYRHDESIFPKPKPNGLKEVEKIIDMMEKMFEKNYYSYFFMHYIEKSLPARRRALQIIEGRIGDLISENKEGIPLKDKKVKIPLTTIGLFNCKSDFTPEPIIEDQISHSPHFPPKERALESSLFDLIHRLPDHQKNELLGYFYDSVQQADKSATLPVEFETLKHPPSELAHPILRRAFDMPYLSFLQYLDLRKHLSANDSEPLFAAIKQNNFLIISLLLDCKIDLNEMEKQKISAEIIKIERLPSYEALSGEAGSFCEGYIHYLNYTRELREQEHSSPNTKMSVI